MKPVATEDTIFTLPAKKIYDFCRALGDDVGLEFIVNDRRISLISPESRIDFSAFDSALFPRLIGDQDNKHALKVNQKNLRQAIDSISYSMAVADIRYYLNGLLFQIEGNELTLVATDGHRLACTIISCSPLKAINHKLNAIIPRRAVLELLRLLDAVDRDIVLNFCPQTLDFTVEDLSFCCKLIEGKYPDYKRVLPKDLPYKIQVDRDDMKQALALIQPILSNKDKGISLNFSKGKIEIKAINNENEQVKVALKAQGEAPNLKIGLNISYLHDFITNAKSKNFSFSLRDDSVGIVMTQEGPGFYVVMPLRL
jgi:DNA polymerase-3 subunit beta